MMDSLWKNTAALPSFPGLEGSLKTDVLIVGGGLTGLLCAYLLQQAGADCALIEADTICSGVSGNTSAKLTSQHGLIYDRLRRRYGLQAACAYYLANEAALQQYRQLCQAIACDYETKDAYVYAAQQALPLEQELRTLEQMGCPAGFVRALPLPFPIAGAIRFPEQAQFHPLKFAAGLSQGLQIYEHTRARSYAPGLVQTDRGSIHAEQIILATHFPPVNKHGLYFLKLYQNRSYVLALTPVPELDGMYLEHTGALSLRSHGSYLLLGGGAHRTGKPGDGWAPLEALARRYFPDATPAFRWAAQDCMPLDGLPYIGRYSSRTEALYTATGFGKWGMSSAMVSAMLLCDLVQGRKNPYAELFSPSRSMLHPQLFKNVLAAAGNLLTPTRPRCPHLGCALKWNRQEHSWDCPCHGSRFAADGTLLDSPATGNLRRKPPPRPPGI